MSTLILPVCYLPVITSKFHTHFMINEINMYSRQSTQ